MKNVAATKGHNVSFAAACLEVGIARAGSWAGKDTVLNSYSRPPKQDALSTPRMSKFAIEEYKSCTGTQEKNVTGTRFLARQ